MEKGDLYKDKKSLYLLLDKQPSGIISSLCLDRTTGKIFGLLKEDIRRMEYLGSLLGLLEEGAQMVILPKPNNGYEMNPEEWEK